MSTQTKEELLIATIRNQVESLKNLLQEMEFEHLNSDALAWRLRAVELQLRRARELT
jgi:hypothetical protein